MAFQLEQALPTASHKAASPIPSTFFSMTTVNSSDYPAVPIGLLGHPNIFAWIEQQKDQYTWTTFNAFVNDAKNHGVPIVITIALTPKWAASDTTVCSSDQHSTWTCTLSRPGGYQGEIVWNTAGSQSLKTSYKQYQDLQGNIKPTNGSVTIGLLPILLETDNI